MKISFITTVYNEEETIEKFLDSIFQQTKMPDEIIIVDGGSSDATAKKIKEIRSKIKDFKGEFHILIKKGNRAVGRNEAIKHATGDFIVCTDAGNILDKEWVKKITEPVVSYETSPQPSPKKRGSYSVDVVAGYYKAIAKTVFQKCVVPYAFVMPDKVNPDTFLPATRSIAFTKSIWEKIGGFDERLSHNEDYAFAKKLQKARARIVFKKDAIVYWMPRTSLQCAYIMMYRFAYGDAEARIWRPKVILLFIRYLLGLLLLITALVMQSISLFLVFVVVFVLYILWSIEKNYRYVKQWQAMYILPLLQLTADWAVLKGTVLGLVGSKLIY